MDEAANYASVNLKELRNSAEMSRNDLLRELESRGINMHTTTLRRLEEGQQQMKVEELIAFCDVFQITLDDFATRPVNEQNARLTELLRELRGRRENIAFYLSTYLFDLDRAIEVLIDKETPSAAQNSTVRAIEGIVKHDKKYRRAMNEVMNAMMTRDPHKSDGEG